MSSEIPLTTLIVYLETAIGVIILLFAAYTAFTVRKGLVVPLYRSRALWLGVLAIILASFLIFFGRVYTPSTYLVGYHRVVGFVFYAGVALPTFVVLLVWIDRTNSTLIRLDYRRKDILGWKKARLLYYADIALFVTFFLIALGPAPGFGYYQMSFPHSAMSFIAANELDPWLIALAYGLSVLVVGSIRTHDLTHKNHAKWLGLSLASLVLALLVGGGSQPIAYFIAIFFAYFWYRMARSLVPVNKLDTSLSMEKGSSAA